jgi:hypothetical protein
MLGEQGLADLALDCLRGSPQRRNYPHPWLGSVLLQRYGGSLRAAPGRETGVWKDQLTSHDRHFSADLDDLPC